MNNKIFLGVLLVLMGLFFTIRQFIPDSIVRMFLNEQLVLFLIGLYFGLIKKKTFGWLLAGLAVYLYVQEFYPDQFKITFPIVILIFGGLLLVKGVSERNTKVINSAKVNMKTDNIIVKTQKNTSDIEDAKEVK